MKTSIIVKHQAAGLHCWHEAPDEVGFLRHLHRHVFHVALKLPVSRSRQLEFFIVQDWLRSVFPGGDMGSSSCEEMAERIGRAALRQFGVDWCECTVDEDGENAAVVEVP